MLLVAKITLRKCWKEAGGEEMANAVLRDDLFACV